MCNKHSQTVLKSTCLDQTDSHVCSAFVKRYIRYLDSYIHTYIQYIHLSRSCFYHLRQLRVVARSLSTSAASTLIHAFVCSRLDYCSSLYTGLPQVHLSSIERVLRSAARLVGSIPRYGSVSSYMHHILHWLPLRHRILYRLCSLVWQCVLGSAPRYLRSIFTLSSSLTGRSALRSSSRGDFLVLFARTATKQRQAFSIVGPTSWNDLPYPSFAY